MTMDCFPVKDVSKMHQARINESPIILSPEKGGEIMVAITSRGRRIQKLTNDIARGLEMTAYNTVNLDTQLYENVADASATQVLKTAAVGRELARNARNELAGITSNREWQEHYRKLAELDGNAHM